MMDNDFEKAYGDYLESMAYEETENLLFSVLRNAFWRAGRPQAAAPPSPPAFLRYWAETGEDEPYAGTGTERIIVPPKRK